MFPGQLHNHLLFGSTLVTESGTLVSEITKFVTSPGAIARTCEK